MIIESGQLYYFNLKYEIINITIVRDKFMKNLLLIQRHIEHVFLFILKFRFFWKIDLRN